MREASRESGKGRQRWGGGERERERERERDRQRQRGTKGGRETEREWEREREREWERERESTKRLLTASLVDGSDNNPTLLAHTDQPYSRYKMRTPAAGLTSPGPNPSEREESGRAAKS